ncbi:MAG: C10 family peptidase [Paludibacteraceae bacterium]|nr:C10 family peptidase [Paludibacteraceae bacterium]
MKKIYFGVMFLMMSMLVCAAPRTVEQAASLAASFQNEQTQKSGVRRAPAKAANMRLAKQVAKPTNMFEAALYVFNNPNGGWVIISADDNTETVIGYSNEGSFDATGKTNVLYILDYLAERVDAASQMTETEKAEYKAMRKAKKQVTPVAPLLQSKGTGINWNQGAPYNGMCPIDGNGKHSLTGCVATAAAQIMAFWQWPKTGEGYTEYEWRSYGGGHELVNANFGETTYDWDNILQANYENITYTQEQADAVALLNFHAGVGAHLSYSASATAGGTDAMGNAMKRYFRYNRGEYIYGYEGSDKWHGLDTTNNWQKWDSLYDAELDAGRPILMGGGDLPGGHEYVCEGRDEDHRYYFNFGWGGSSNGYFYISGMNPKKGYEFSHDIDAVMGIYPDTLPRVAPVTALSINKHSLEMSTRESVKLKATLTPAEPSNDGVYWKSSNRDVATVDKDGNVTAVAPGFATIMAGSCDGDFKDSCKVTVSNEGTKGSLTFITDLADVNKCRWSGSKGKYELILDNESQGQYPWLEFNLSALTNNYTLAGRYDLSKEYLLAYPSSANHGIAFYASSGWLNIGCIDGDTHTYQIDGFFSDGKGNDYAFSYTTILNMEKHALEDQTGDGVISTVVTTFMSMGEIYETQVVVDGKLSLPSLKPLSCNELAFVGWTADATYTGGTTAPTLVADGEAISENTTYYAVYGIPSGVGPYTEEASVEFNTFAEDGDDHYWYDPGTGYHFDEIGDLIGATSNLTLNTGAWLRKGKDGIRIGGSGSGAKGSDQGYLLFDLNEAKNIKKVVVNCSKVGDEKALVRVDMNNASPKKTDTMLEAIGGDLEFVLDKEVATSSVRVGTTGNTAYFRSIKLYSGGEQYYSSYTTMDCPKHNIATANVENGTVETDVNEANAEDIVTITATPDAGYVFGSVSVKDASNNDILVTDNKFVMPASDVTVSATFEKLYNVNISTSIENGTVEADFSQAAAGQVVTLTVTPNTNYELATLTVSGGPGVGFIQVDENNQFIMPAANVMVMATFASTAPAEYQINFGTIENGTVEANVSQAQEGETITLTITPDECYELTSLSVKNGPMNVITVDENNQFIMPAGAVYINATFSLIEYAINIADAEHGTVEADFQNATSGEVVTITATPDEQYELASLIVTDDNNNIIDIENDGSFIMPCAAVTISAQFSKKDPTALNSVETEKTAIKLIEDGVVYIIRGGEKFDIYGQKVQ